MYCCQPGRSLSAGEKSYADASGEGADRRVPGCLQAANRPARESVLDSEMWAERWHPPVPRPCNRRAAIAAVCNDTSLMRHNRCSVSVAMATLNGQAFLADQLASLQDQTQPPEELVICDDGSSDATIDIAN